MPTYPEPREKGNLLRILKSLRRRNRELCNTSTKWTYRITDLKFFGEGQASKFWAVGALVEQHGPGTKEARLGAQEWLLLNNRTNN